MAEERFTALALAGGVLEDDFRAAGYVAANKAYLPVGGVPMLTRVLQALRASDSIARIRCVTPVEAFRQLGSGSDLCDDVVGPSGDLVGSLLAGMAGLPSAQRVIIVATDMPLLSAQAVDSFAGLARATPCDIGYGFVERRAHERAYPQVRHTWVRLREGTYCGAGVSVMRAGAAPQVQDVLRRFTAARKSPLKLASLFSYGLLLKALSGTLCISEVERRASEVSGLVCRGLLCDQPELAVNIDQIADLRTIEQIIGRR